MSIKCEINDLTLERDITLKCVRLERSAVFKYTRLDYRK